ncbi:MAG: FHA domain-containing protein [Cyanosarcina radialis HA8281-LM2]|nr:FHA domain-containing protein [Cyanosarcina radialis HA8281-LM2]
MNELTLEWVETSNGINQRRSQVVGDRQPSKNFGTIRIGRDPEQCDIVVNHQTVSRLHAEIYFHQQQQSFYLRNQSQSNPATVDGQSLARGEVPLRLGSNISLGQLSLAVVNVALEAVPLQRTVVVSGGSPQPQPAVNQPPVAPNHRYHHHQNPNQQWQQQQVAVKSPPPPPPPPAIPTPIAQGESYGLQCHRCGKVSDYSALDCRHCGTSLAGAISVLVRPGSR